MSTICWRGGGGVLPPPRVCQVVGSRECSSEGAAAGSSREDRIEGDGTATGGDTDDDTAGLLVRHVDLDPRGGGGADGPMKQGRRRPERGPGLLGSEEEGSC